MLKQPEEMPKCSNLQLSSDDSDRPRRPGCCKGGQKLSTCKSFQYHSGYIFTIINQVGDLPSGLGAREAKRLLSNLKQQQQPGERKYGYFSLCLTRVYFCQGAAARMTCSPCRSGCLGWGSRRWGGRLGWVYVNLHKWTIINLQGVH